MPDEAQIEERDTGRVPVSDGWFVLNARDSPWHHAPGRTALCEFEGEGEAQFRQLGINVSVLEPGQPMSQYHWEADQEDFLVLCGECLLIIEGQERPLRAWDLAHCPSGVAHAIVGAGTGPSVVLAVGARDHLSDEDWGAYPVDAVAQRHGAGVKVETSDPDQAYAGLTRRNPVPYDPRWLPG